MNPTVQQLRAAIADLVELAQGYAATPEQIAEVAAKHDIEPWIIEGRWFEACEEAGEQ